MAISRKGSWRQATIASSSKGPDTPVFTSRGSVSAQVLMALLVVATTEFADVKEK
jgi:hypothetical protein